MAIDISNLPNGIVPPEIAEAMNNLLLVQGRIKFPLKPTNTSAVSTSTESQDTIEDNIEDEIDELIASVAEMEDLVEQLEDMADELTKDMNIPVDASNKKLLRAVQLLGGDNAITKDVFDTAMSIIEHAPLMTLRQDPVMAALTGDGHIDGPWMECSQVTSNAADLFNLRKNQVTFPDEPVVPKNEEILRDFEENLLAMILHIVLMLWWNMLWPKFIVDLTIIDPLRLMIADPLDKLIGFFKNKKIRRKSKEWVRKNGKINKALNTFRTFLLCNVPYKLWKTAKKDYDPIVEVDCPATRLKECSDSSNVEEGPEKKISDKGNKALEQSFGDEETDEVCASPSEFGLNAPKEEATGLGMPPECLQAASRIVNAVETAAYTPRKPNPNDPTLQTDLSVLVKENMPPGSLVKA